MEKNWTIKSQGPEAEVIALSRALGISKVLANLLIQRGINTFDEAKTFFRPELSHLHDPFLMKDMDVACDRIEAAIKSKESVLIYGDYDVDGTTAVALMYSFLKDYFDNIDYYIPNRYSEGYGVSKKGIDFADEKGHRLIIALDCGIKAVEKVAYAKSKGIDFIICDHHTPGDTLPEAVAVLDAKRADCAYPYKELSGCGVGFKLAQAMAKRLDLEFESITHLLDLVVVSIASDIVPINGENRVLAHFGLQKLSKSPRIGLQAIKNIASFDEKNITIEEIVFKIGPRLNAAGRMESGRTAVELLVSDDSEQALSFSKNIDTINIERRDVDTSITRQAVEMIVSNKELQGKKYTILYNPDWHKGVIGIVASRLMEHFYRPTIVLTKSNGFATGSARSVNGFDLYQAIESCSDLLENFGGHKYAAGLTMKVSNIKAFSKRFEEYVHATIDPDMLIPVVEIDTELQLEEIDDKFVRVLNQFRPFGPENMAPIFLTESIADNGMGKRVGTDGDHLRLQLVEEANPFKVFTAIAFQQGNKFQKVSHGKPFDLCYSVEENEYRGRTTVQLNVKDLKFD
ncbi:MAG: single-stranded-DNA-specific exonuclease RecJ [Bacteroidales bacterium]|jgi:single-stranded-DNA-specific exonuclease|nr:single-stranded-DNA-specific exonuclease RecJ [Bacteroidales bacterium]